jgi:hypothetical protein
MNNSDNQDGRPSGLAAAENGSNSRDQDVTFRGGISRGIGSGINDGLNGGAGTASTGAGSRFPEQEGQGPVVHQPDFSGRSEKAFRPHSAMSRVSYLRNAPRVVLHPEVYRTMLLYVERAPLEVGWQGTAVRRGNDFIIDRVYLLKQTVSAATTDLSVQGRDDLCMELLGQGAAGVEAVNNLRFWGHSHVRMEVEASGRDEATMREFEEGGLPWAIRGIFNKLGRGKFSLFLYEDGMRIDDVPWVVVDPVSGSTLLSAPLGRSFAPGWGRESCLFTSQERGQVDSGRAFFGSHSPYNDLPPELVPDEALRAVVSADYKNKVDERGFASWAGRLFGDSDELPGLPGRRNFGAGSGQERNGAGIMPIGVSEGGRTTVIREVSADRDRLGEVLGDTQIRPGFQFDDEGRGAVRDVQPVNRRPVSPRQDGESSGIVGSVLNALGLGRLSNSSASKKGERK